MSEYQYYEFLAIDRRLTAAEMAQLRGYSSRARITPTGFVNDYQWGELKGNPDRWMESYFDVFLYFANWGTRELQFRVPSKLLDVEAAALYCVDDSVSVRSHKGNTIVAYQSEIEGDEDWIDQHDALASLVPIRAQLAQGDLRALYLGWLLCAQNGLLEDNEPEPPVPPGLAERDGALDRLIDFLGIDEDLVTVAAAASSALRTREVSHKTIRSWIDGLPSVRRDGLLERFITAKETGLALEIQREIGKTEAAVVSQTGRTVGTLLSAAEEVAERRRRAEEERRERERRKREGEAAQARAEYLDGLARREAAVWVEIEALIATKQPEHYDRAAVLLRDLRDVAVSNDAVATFLERLAALREAHARKPSLLARIDRAQLGAV